MDALTGIIEHRVLETNGIRLHGVDAGPRDARSVILLHGFPEFWYGWRKQIPYLAGLGFHVLAPDLRGYNLSDKPPGVCSYRLDVLAEDVVGLIDRYAGGRAFLVAHDWGGAIAWWVAQNYPERLDRLVILNAPHGRVFKKLLRTSLKQRLRSTYALFFQLPVIPELLSRLFRFPVGPVLLKGSARPGAFSKAELAEYRKAMYQPHALNRTLNYYRAVIRCQNVARIPDPHVHVPTLIIWGRRDIALSEELAHRSLEYCTNGRLELIGEATHWVQHEEPQRVNTLISEFLTGHGT